MLIWPIYPEHKTISGAYYTSKANRQEGQMKLATRTLSIAQLAASTKIFDVAPTNATILHLEKRPSAIIYSPSELVVGCFEGEDFIYQ